MSRRRSSLTLSLFPFLAVLICTMGVLVALLLLVVKQADQSAKKKVEEVRQQIDQKIETIKDDMAINELRSSVMIEARVKLIEQVQQKRALRSHLDNEIANLAKRGEQLEQEIAAFQLSQQAVDLPEIRKLLEHNLEQLQSAKAKMSDLENSVVDEGQPSAAPVYSIVPIAARNGTDRRPIYIECSEEGITLFPGGHKLGPEDFVLPLQAGNPLDSALVAYREQWRMETKDTDGAYPLMVVRPSGAHWYAVIRRAMQSWEDEFGYELVPEDWEVDFGESNSELDQRVTQAIELALHRQNALVRMGRAKSLTDPRENLHSQQLAQESPAGLVPANGGGFAAMPASHATPTGFDSRLSTDSSGRPIDPLASLSADYHRNRQDAGSGNAFVGPSSSNESSSSFIRDSAYPSTGAIGNQSHVLESAFASEESVFSTVEASTNRIPVLATNSGSVGSSSTSGKQTKNPGSSVANGSTEQAEGLASYGPNSGGTSSGNSTMGTPTGNPSRPPTEMNSQGTQPKQATGPGQLHQQSLARQRGADWALPSRRPNVSAYHRPIAVEVDSQKIVLRPGLWNSETITIKLESSLESSIDPMIDAVWKRVASWGNLGFDGYWKPVLAIRTSPLNLQQVQRLEALLDGSGLAIERVKE